MLFDMTLEENILYGKPDATYDQMATAARMANIDFVGEDKLVQWSDPVGARGEKLSGNIFY